jgi:hypothetical protein
MPPCRPQRCVRNAKPTLESSECVELIRIDDADRGVVDGSHMCEPFRAAEKSLYRPRVYSHLPDGISASSNCPRGEITPKNFESHSKSSRPLNMQFGRAPSRRWHQTVFIFIRRSAIICVLRTFFDFVVRLSIVPYGFDTQSFIVEFPVVASI